MDETSSCPRCGASLDTVTPEGLCAECLLRGALEGFTQERSKSEAAALELGTAVRYLGDYELLEEIGRGAMGVVFRARQESLGRQVAVKLLLGGAWASELAIERFRAEAQAAAAIQHPSIVAIHEVGEHEGQPYFSMDLIEGHSLEDLLGNGPFEPSHAAEVIAEIAEAVQHAHGRGILHRDLKPSNVLIHPEGRPVITDFGLAKNLGLEVGLTVTGQLLGTPGYMAPEQAVATTTAAGDPAGPAADVYSLGAILYALVTGRPPFSEEGPVETVLAQMRTDPTPPRHVDQRLPADLEAICLKCLERDPRKRYESAWDLAEDLRRFLGGRPVEARPLSAAARSWRWLRRRPAAAGLVVLTSFLISMLIWWQPVIREPAPEMTGVPAQEETLEAAGPTQANDPGEPRDRGDTSPSDPGTTGEPSRPNQPEVPTKDIAAPASEAESPGFRRSGSFGIRATRELSFDSRGERLAMIQELPGRRMILVIDVASGRQLERVEAAAAPEPSGLPPVLINIGTTAVVSAYGPTPRLSFWNPALGSISEITGPENPQLADGPQMVDLALSPGGRWASIGDLRAQIFNVRDLVAGSVHLGRRGLPATIRDDGQLLYRRADGLFSWNLVSGSLGPPLFPGAASAVSRNGRIALRSASGSRDLEVWDVEARRRLGVIPDHPGDRGSLARLSQDGELLAIGGPTGAEGLRIWRTRVPELGPRRLRLESWQRVVLRHSAFSPDGTMLAIAGGEHGRGALWIWGVDTGKLIAELADQHSAAWSPDGRLLASAGGLGTDQVEHSSVSFDGITVGNSTTTLWEVEPPQTALKIADRPVRSISFSPDGRQLATDHLLWDLGPRREAPRPSSWVARGDFARFDARGRLWAIEHAHDVLQDELPLSLEQVEPQSRALKLEEEGLTLGTAFDFHPEGEVVAVASALLRLTDGGRETAADGHVVEGYDLETGLRRWLAPRPRGMQPVSALAFDPSSTYLVVAEHSEQAEGHGISLWDANTGEPLGGLPHAPLAQAIAFSSDGRLLISAGLGGTIDVSNLKTKTTRSWEAGQSTVLALAVSSDARLLASGGRAPALTLWDLESGEEIGRWPAHEEGITALAFHPQHNLLVSGGAGGTVKVWNVEALLKGLTDRSG